MQAHGGSIVNIIADMWHGMPGMGHSGAARAAMLNFTQTASLEWAPVRVNAVAPGWIASSGLDKYPAEMQSHIQQLHAHTPLQRLGTESEISSAIVFLLSPASAFTSGEHPHFTSTLFTFLIFVAQALVSRSMALRQMPNATGTWLLTAAAHDPSTGLLCQVCHSVTQLCAPN